ncbi:MAG: GNAT family N-acetyltransferase [Chloroflexi bacterium]|nr:GNAT family N-acetyltransferase [Chloroflexota bacterium]
MTRISVRPFAAGPPAPDGVRPVNLRTDLRPLADLIELVFSASMDSSGRSAIREMRFLSGMGYGLKLIARVNELALGISLGYVYIKNGELVGNVSVYPANYPTELGETWILANVGVHPDHQRSGIAHELMLASLDMIRKRGAARIILQVNCDNAGALRLYERHGFIYERAWRVWRRSGFSQAPFARINDFHITRRRPSEWGAEYALARASRPNSSGGLGWLKPLHKAAFQTSLWKRLKDLASLNSLERLVIRDESAGEILASCWLESAISFGSIRAWLFTSPHIDHEVYAQALLGNVVSRFSRSTIVLEHPRDDETVSDLLKVHRFQVKRELWHMRLDL